MLELLRPAHKPPTAETHVYLLKNVNRHTQPDIDKFTHAVDSVQSILFLGLKREN